METINLDKLVTPPPITVRTEALEYSDNNTPGEMKVDASGRLLKRYLEFESTVGSLVDTYNNFISNALPNHIMSRSLSIPSGTVTFENILLNKPLVKSLNGNLVPLYPQTCREKGYSYTADIYCDLVLNKGTPNEERITHSFLGKIPVMIGSQLDWLSTMTVTEKSKLGESITDVGGAFCIKGADKLILMQEKLRQNLIMLFNSTNKGSVICKITNNTFMGSTQITMTQGKKSLSLKVHFGFLGNRKGPSNKLGNTIGVFQVFRMLGVSKAEDILAFLLSFTKKENTKRIIVAVQPSFVKLYKIGDDIEYISKKKGLGNLDYNIRKSDILKDLLSQLFPQVPANDIQGKLYMLSIMTIRLLEYLIGVRELDDRDDYANKQIVSGGKSLELLFASIWRELIIKAQDEISDNNLSGLKAVQRVLDPSFITDNFIESFTANKWGVQSSFMAKENITDFLKRDSVLYVLSHLSMINTPTSKKAKAPKVRMVQMSQLGYVDAADTPEGSMCIKYDTSVLMSDFSWKQIKDIIEGDEVITVNPYTGERTPSKITQPFTFHTQNSGKQMFKVLTEDGNEIFATGDHPFMIYNNFENEWIRCDKLKTGNLLVKYDSIKDSLYISAIVDISFSEDTQVCDFTTYSENHSFVANGFVTHNCGLTKHAAMTMYASLDRPEEIVIQLLGKYVSKVKTEQQINPYMLNGVFQGWINGSEFYKYAKALKISAKLPKDTCIVLEKDGFFHIYTDGCRPTRPLLIVDTDGELVIEKKNLWEADFNTLLREGCAEYIDAWEQENIMLAQSMDDVKMRKSDLEMAYRAVREAQDKLQQGNFKSSLEEQNAKILLTEAQNALQEIQNLAPYTHCEIDPTAIMSISVAVIPLAETNPGPRLTYQSGMGKQALGIYHSNHMSRFDTTAKLLSFPTRPMFETQMNSIIGLDQLPAGDTVILAITTYSGFSQEDALIMNQASIDRGLFRSVVYKTYSSILNKTKFTVETFARPEIPRKEMEDKYAAIGEDGLPKLGSHVRGGDCLIGKIRKNIQTGEIENASSFVEVKQEGVVDKVLVSTNADGNRVVKVKIRQVRKPTIGDKYASRYAQKGTVGMILREEDMPFTASGLKPDIIINPHCGSYDTPVSMYNGTSKQLGDFSYEGGEKLWAWDEKNEKFVVSSSMGMDSRGYKKLLNITLEDGRILRFTSDHKIITVNEDKSYKWLESKDLLNKTLICGPEFPLEDCVTGCERELAFARLAGFLTQKDIENVNSEIDLANIKEDLTLFTDGEASFSNLTKFKYTLFQDYEKIADFLIKEFLGGYFGTKEKFDENFLLNEKNDYILRLLDFLEIRTERDFAEKIGFRYNFNNSIQLSILLSYLRSESTLPFQEYKKKYFNEKNNCFYMKVVKIEESGIEEVFDIGVHDQHNFLAHGVVVSNCIPSRMTMGKMIEIVASKTAAFTGERVNATAFRDFEVQEFMRNLKQYGYSPSGKERMSSGFTGKPLDAMIFIGPCYYQALRHQVKDKMQMRARGGISQLTRQPVGGIKRGGGQRVGEMERDAIISHGAAAFLQDRLCKNSDAYEAVYCQSCGTMAIANPTEDRYVCRACKDEAHFGKCEIPYAFKLLTQLLMGAGLMTRMKFQEIKK
jgi:DNA-directed RNA polymerase beta subunit/intein/homing endonuclease